MNKKRLPDGQPIINPIAVKQLHQILNAADHRPFRCFWSIPLKT